MDMRIIADPRTGAAIAAAAGVRVHPNRGGRDVRIYLNRVTAADLRAIADGMEAVGETHRLPRPGEE